MPELKESFMPSISVLLLPLVISWTALASEKIINHGASDLTKESIEMLNRGITSNQQGRVGQCQNVRFGYEERAYPLGLTVGKVKVEGMDRFGVRFSHDYPLDRTAMMYIVESESSFTFHIFTETEHLTRQSLTGSITIDMDHKTEMVRNLQMGIAEHPCSEISLGDRLSQIVQYVFY
jgi:hypothetical protein